MNNDDILATAVLTVFFGTPILLIIHYWWKVKTQKEKDEFKHNAQSIGTAIGTFIIVGLGILAVLMALTGGRRHY